MNDLFPDTNVRTGYLGHAANLSPGQHTLNIHKPIRLPIPTPLNNPHARLTTNLRIPSPLLSSYLNLLLTRQSCDRKARIKRKHLRACLHHLSLVASSHHIQRRLAHAILWVRVGIQLVSRVGALADGAQIAREVDQTFILTASSVRLVEEKRLERLGQCIRSDEIYLERFAQTGGRVGGGGDDAGVVDQDVETAGFGLDGGDGGGDGGGRGHVEME